MASKKYGPEHLRPLRTSWKNIPTEALPLDKQTVYLSRKKAVDMYIDGNSLSEIEQTTGIKMAQVSKLIAKCVAMDSAGNMLGYAALIPYNRIDVDKPSGKFGILMQTYPEIAEYVAGCYFGDEKYTTEHNMNLVTLHENFLKKCLDVGIETYEYPFNTTHKGYVSLKKWVDNLRTENLEKQAKRENKDNQQKLFSTGIGERYTADPIAPFATVQVDGHIIDMEYIVEVTNKDGTIDKKIATRPWLFAVIDVATRCILGYSLSQSYNYDQYIVIKAVQNAIIPHKRMKFNIKGLDYPAEGGYVSFRFPELDYALFDSIMLDNAKSHLSNYTVSRIVNEMNCAMNFGSVATPETRGIVERFFETLETRGFHKLPFTTGSNTKDLKRKNPEKAAVKYNVTYDDLCELIEVLIAEYNCTPNKGIDNRTPLELLERRVFEVGMMPTIADDAMKEKIERLTYVVETRVVRGSSSKGKRPYIHYEGADYRGPELSASWRYIGHTLTLHINPDDITSVYAYDEDGTPVGYLTARGEFGQVSHSLKTRKNANKLSKERGTTRNIFHPAISAYQEELNERGQKDRRSATKADQVRREMKKPTPSEQKKSAHIHTIPKKSAPLETKNKNSNHMPSTEEVANMTLDELKVALFGK